MQRASNIAGHFVRQGSSIQRKCPARETRTARRICLSSTEKKVWQGMKMSGRACQTFCPMTASGPFRTLTGWQDGCVATTLATRTVNSGKRRPDKQTGSLAWSPGAT